MAQEEKPLEFIPPGVHAYAEKSVAAGDTIHFRVSSDVPYKLSVVQLGPNLDGPDEDDKELPPAFTSGPRQQPITPGSYVTVTKTLPNENLAALTLECWVRPWTNKLSNRKSWQGLLTSYSYSTQCGFGLFLTDKGNVLFYCGDGGLYNAEWELLSPAPLAFCDDTPAPWYHVVGVWNGQVMSLWIDGQKVDESTPSSTSRSVRPGTAPLRLAAYGKDGRTCNFLDGDLAVPVIYTRALTPEEIARRCAQRDTDNGVQPPDDMTGVLACWPMSEERGTTLQDISDNGFHGRIINGATWQIGGPSLGPTIDPNDDSKFNKDYDPAQDKTRGHGLRFASDDLYDAGWEVSHSFPLPSNLEPGIYVGRIRYNKDDTGQRYEDDKEKAGFYKDLYDVTFVVRKPAEAPKNPILVLAATNSWLAYSCTPFVKNDTAMSNPRQRWYPGQPEGLDGPPEAPNYNFYRNHHYESVGGLLCNGQPTYRMGLNLPWPAAAPYYVYSPEDTVGYSHLTRAERFLHRWLKQQGYDFDVLSDFDLQRKPDILQAYPVVIINGHSEYWSAEVYQGLERYLGRGGKVIVLSGNTMFWRVSFDEGLSVMECRKPSQFENAGAGAYAAQWECYHSTDGKYGSLMRKSGYPCWKLLGMESSGFISDNETNDARRPYSCTNPNHPFFEGTGLTHGATFADRAVGHEWDILVSEEQQDSGIPPLENLEILASSQVHTAEDPNKTDTVWNYKVETIDKKSLKAEYLNSQVIYWKRPEGGEVFYAGTIGASWSLYRADNPNAAQPSDHQDLWGRVVKNVLTSFGVRPRPKIGVSSE
ncbi:LamG domain-containing protein [Archangium lipolyticum]|uniref:LamG domain-containing protein n=1 Tax=Archangium lipolyticum TaxID=2970465 RepID=UPI00214A3C6C|nr:LamG domain-containing protein [Archangium lipolyticum]